MEGDSMNLNHGMWLSMDDGIHDDMYPVTIHNEDGHLIPNNISIIQ